MEPCQLASGALVWPERWYIEGKNLRGTGFSISQENSVLSVDRHHFVDFSVSDIALTAPELKTAYRELSFEGTLYLPLL